MSLAESPIAFPNTSIKAVLGASLYLEAEVSPVMVIDVA